MMDWLRLATDFRDFGLHPEVFTIPAFALGGTMLGPFALRWYSLAYITGIVAGWWLLLRMIRRPGAPVSAQQLDDFITWATLGVILGGRLGYVLFYNFDKYAADPVEIIRLWDGGMSFHGGAAGVIVACLLYGWKHGFAGIRLLDYVACVEPIGQGLGRIANFINGELWGRPTGDGSGIIFPDAGPEPRYPSQLYEAGLEGAVLFAVLMWLFWRTDARLRPGLLSGVFGVGYGCARFVVEFYREPDRQLGYLAGGLTMGQLLTLPLIAAGLALIVWAMARKKVPAAAT